MSSKELAKVAAAQQKKTPDTLLSALKSGNPLVLASFLVMGLGNIAAGQIIKGLLFLAIEIGVIAFLVMRGGGIYWLSMLPSLGDRPMQEIWNDDKGVYEYVMGEYGPSFECIKYTTTLNDNYCVGTNPSQVMNVSRAEYEKYINDINDDYEVSLSGRVSDGYFTIDEALDAYLN